MVRPHRKYDSVTRRALVALTHPSAAFQRLEYRVGDFRSRRHDKRTDQYNDFTCSKEDAVRKLTSADNEAVDLAFADLSRNVVFLEYIEHSLDSGHDLIKGGISSAGDVSASHRELLYVLCKVIKPEVVLETGVANGVSSAFILKALDESNAGTLYSIDLPSVALRTVFHRESGWIIPKELRHRWKLFVGASRSLLPRVLPGLGVDLFLHDSDHSYDNMLFEFKCVWPFIRPGGVLASDDAIGHDALLDFCDSVGCAPIIVKDAPPHAFGAVRKLRAQ